MNNVINDTMSGLQLPKQSTTMRFIAHMTIVVVTGLSRGSPVPSGGSLSLPPYPYGLFWHHDYTLPIPQSKRNDNTPAEQTPPPPLDR